ncbi:MAG: hypothetical protein U5K54_08305 [Cytophagales bacterium]|nr:hypothetical protein [Cytophagales bacterium]
MVIWVQQWSAFFYEMGGGSLPDLGVYNLATLTGLLGPAKSVMAMTSIITPERTVDDKGKIKVEAERQRYGIDGTCPWSFIPCAVWF